MVQTKLYSLVIKLLEKHKLSINGTDYRATELYSSGEQNAAVSSKYYALHTSEVWFPELAEEFRMTNTVCNFQKWKESLLVVHNVKHLLGPNLYVPPTLMTALREFEMPKHVVFVSEPVYEQCLLSLQNRWKIC